MKSRLPFIAFFLMAISALPAVTKGFDHQHARFDGVVKNHVVTGQVNYKALRDSPAELDQYLDALAGVSEVEFKSWTESQQLAMLINLYNAATLKLITDNYPVATIKKIGSLFKGPWDQPVVRLWGNTVTLNNLEHDIIRVRYPHVPEIHFALVCAAMGCPPLRSEAFTPDQLTEQLIDQRRIFLSTREKNAIDQSKRRLSLSPIFKWYGGDFEKNAGSVQAYLKVQWPEVDETYSIRYSSYDWSLNELK